MMAGTTSQNFTRPLRRHGICRLRRFATVGERMHVRFRPLIMFAGATEFQEALSRRKRKNKGRNISR